MELKRLGFSSVHAMEFSATFELPRIAWTENRMWSNRKNFMGFWRIPGGYFRDFDAFSGFCHELTEPVVGVILDIFFFPASGWRIIKNFDRNNMKVLAEWMQLGASLELSQNKWRGGKDRYSKRSSIAPPSYNRSNKYKYWWSLVWGRWCNRGGGGRSRNRKVWKNPWCWLLLWIGRMIKDSSEDSFEIFLKETRLLFCRPDEDFSGFFCLLLGYANYKKKNKGKRKNHNTTTRSRGSIWNEPERGVLEGGMGIRGSLTPRVPKNKSKNLWMILNKRLNVQYQI